MASLPPQTIGLIMDLMARGRSGGLPMQASPELLQYMAHAQAGSTPPQQRNLPSADVLQGPGSGYGAIRMDDFLGETGAVPTSAPQESQLSMLDMMSETGRPPPNVFRQEGAGNFTDSPLFVFVTNASGKRIRVAGPFTDDVSAQSALNRLAKNSKGVQLDIGPWTQE